jgi:hypothetical protein
MRASSARAQALRAPTPPGPADPIAFVALIHMGALEAGGTVAQSLEVSDLLPPDVAADERARQMVVALADAHAALAVVAQLAGRIRAGMLSIPAPVGLRLVEGGA